MAQEYKGWKLFDEIILITRPKDENGYEQAYLVDIKSKTSKEAAIRWADYYGKSYNEYQFKNEDFEVELYDSANGSYQGGKLSFWDCIVHKDNHKFRIGINSDILIELLKNCTMVNGKIKEKVIFAKKHGQTGLLHKNMKEYKEAIQDEATRIAMKTNTTSKYKRGYEYSTLTTSDVYICEIYDWVEVVREKWLSTECRLLDKPKKKIVFLSLYKDEEETCKTISDLFAKDIERINHEKYRYSRILNYIQSSKPKRVENRQVLIDDFSEESLQKLINAWQCSDKTDINHWRYSSNPNIKPKIDKTMFTRIEWV